jgi:putative ABC transport system permease protein
MPDWRTAIRARLDSPSAVPDDVLDEMAQHLDDRYHALVASGRTDEQARAETLEELREPPVADAERPAPTSCPPLGRDDRRSARLLPFVALAFFGRHARFGLRLLRRSAGFTTVAVSTLGLGVAVTTAIFSVVYGLFFAPLPYRQPDRLVMVWEYANGQRLSVSPRSYAAWKRQAAVFAEINAWGGRTVNLATPDRPENVGAGVVTPGFLGMLGYGHPLALGRSFREDEGTPGHDRVVILTYRVWQQHFAGDPGIIGRQVRLNDEPYTVIGVLGQGPADRQQNKIWLPLAFTDADLQSDVPRWWVMARLRDDVTLDQANASLTALGARLERERSRPRGDWSVRVEAFRNDFVTPGTTRGIWLLFGAVLFVLLIACTNVANLLLTRGTARQRELAIRASLGATRWSILGQLLVEALVLAVAGGAVGTLLAVAIVKAIVALMPPFTLPSETEITLSVPVLIFALAACTLSALVAGLMPAWQASRANAADAMKEGGRTIGDRRFGLRRALVVVEFALALTLLAGGGMAVHALVRLMTANPGFQAHHLTTFSLPVPRGRLATPDETGAFYGSLVERIAAVPGVAAVSVSTAMPVGGGAFTRPFEVAGSRAGDPAARPRTLVDAVSPSYHATFGIPLRRGRTFNDTDRPGSQPVAIVNEAFAAEFFPGREPVGERLVMSPIPLATGNGPASIDPPAIEWEIVGVQADVANAGLGRPTAPEVLIPFAQNPWPAAIVAVRTTGNDGVPVRAIADVVGNLDPTLPMARVQTIEQTLRASMASDRFYGVFLAAFAIVALVLAAVGIYGVMSFAVAQRTHEIGLRMALGAAKRQVLGQILREGMTTALTGAVLGATGAAFVGRMLQGTIYGVDPSNPLTFVAISTTLFAAAFLACLVPACRAASVNPMTALRQP